MEEVYAVVVSSSDAEEEDGGGRRRGRASIRRSRSSERSTSRLGPAPAGRKRRRIRKKGDGPLTTEQHCTEVTERVDFDFLSEDFLECLDGFHAIPSTKELWVDKYEPSSLAELAVNKKKVEEVRLWLEERVRASKEDVRNHTLVVTGHAGVGKSAAIHVIASQLGAELCEWRTPTPTLWKEYIHNSNSGISYMSKLDEFEAFVDTVRKYAVLQVKDAGGLRKPVILLIDDLPVTNGRVAFGRLCKCLNVLAHSTQVPTVVLITQYLKDDSSDIRACNWDELESSLERAGSYKVLFNPLTANSIKKTLMRICREEKCNVSEELLHQISRLSQGDIRHAITSLQYFCLRPEQPPFIPGSKAIGRYFQGTSGAAGLPLSRINVDNGPSGSITMPFGRDETLTIFHALGKFLHNKRENGDVSSIGTNAGTLKEKFQRLQLKMDAPENVLYQAHAQARPIADFLHENVLDFLGDEAIDDAWIIASYLSDADCLLATSISSAWSQMVKGSYGPEVLSQSIAASVSVRGVLFGNSQPLPSRWHSIRRPKLWQIEQSSKRNKSVATSERLQACTFTLCSASDIATEYKPMIRWLGSMSSQPPLLHERLLRCCSVESDGLDNFEADHSLGENEEDDIEEW